MTRISVTVPSEADVRLLLSWLVDRSAWLELTPLPDGRWEAVVRREHEAAMRRAWPYADIKELP